MPVVHGGGAVQRVGHEGDDRVAPVDHVADDVEVRVGRHHAGGETLPVLRVDAAEVARLELPDRLDVDQVLEHVRHPNAVGV